MDQGAPGKKEKTAAVSDLQVFCLVPSKSYQMKSYFGDAHPLPLKSQVKGWLSISSSSSASRSTARQSYE